MVVVEVTVAVVCGWWNTGTAAAAVSCMLHAMASFVRASGGALLCLAQSPIDGHTAATPYIMPPRRREGKAAGKTAIIKTKKWTHTYPEYEQVGQARRQVMEGAKQQTHDWKTSRCESNEKKVNDRPTLLGGQKEMAQEGRWR